MLTFQIRLAIILDDNDFHYRVKGGEETMKRFATVMTAATLVALVLSGCGNTKTHSGDKKDTRTYIDPTGEEIQIPEKPDTIVTDFYAGELLAVGANVVGSGSWSFSNPFIQEELQEIKDLGDPINTEEVLDLAPDLIVVMDGEQADKLSQIAPTVVIPYNTAKSVEESLDLFGELANTEEEAETFLAQYEKEATAAKERVEEVIGEDDTFGIYELTNKGEFWVFNDNGGRGGQVLYNAFDLHAPDRIEEEVIKTGEMKQLSPEVVPDYAADYMFITDYNPEGDSTTLEELEGSTIWQSLDAVKNERVFINDFDTFYPYDPISIRNQLGLFADMIVERAKTNE